MTAPDLFAWRDEAEAAERVAQAEAVRAEAEWRVKCAPRGTLTERKAALDLATRAALEAALDLGRVQQRRATA